MRPNKSGVWEWFEEDGTKRLVEVINVNPEDLGAPYLRVAFWGGYYNVNDEPDPDHPEYDWATKAEWPDRWGNYVGPNHSLPESEIYYIPTQAEYDKIMAEVEDEKPPGK
jgi:hypothetical protein